MGFIKRLPGHESTNASSQPPAPPPPASPPPPPPPGGQTIRLNLPHEPTLANLPLLAELVVKNEGAHGVPLDYSIESLKLIDMMLNNLWMQGATPQTVPDVVFCMGCYVGEVMRRAYGGEWVEPRQDIPLGPFPLLKYGGGSLCSPIGKAFKYLRNGPGDSVHYFAFVMKPKAPAQS